MQLFFLLLIFLWTSFGPAKELRIEQLRIEQTRDLCEQLSNENVTSIEGQPVGARKEHLLLFVRQNCELLEAAEDEGSLQSANAQKLFFDLQYVQKSWLNKFALDEGVGLFDILMMGLTHDLSPWLLRYENPPAMRKVPNPADSVFWKNPQGSRELLFDQQANDKGIEWKNVSVVRLDKLEAKGSTPKAHVLDVLTRSRWLMKWGDEVHTDPVASRIFAALGYYVDHPYFFPSGKLTLILGKTQLNKKRTPAHFVRFLYNAFGTNLSPFILQTGKISKKLAAENSLFAGFEGEYFITFKASALEARPARELRLGSILSALPENLQRTELRGALLAHLWLGTWDSKESNTLLSIVLDPQNRPRLVGSFSDLGVSLGVKISKFPRDFKAGLVNYFAWDLVQSSPEQIRFQAHLNSLSAAYRAADYSDLHWMARQIAQIDQTVLRAALAASGWPEYLQTLYFYKLAERRRQILQAFQVADPSPISLDRKYSYAENATTYIQDGELLIEPSLQEFPEGLLHSKGRFRGFGW